MPSVLACPRPKLKSVRCRLDDPDVALMLRVQGDEPGGQGASTVEFFIDYEFRSRVLGLLMGSMFDTAFRRFAAAFERRADEVYGRRGAASAASASRSSATSTDF